MIDYGCNVVDISCQGHVLTALSSLEASIVRTEEDDLVQIIRDSREEIMLAPTRNRSRVCSGGGMIDGNTLRA